MLLADANQNLTGWFVNPVDRPSWVVLSQLVHQHVNGEPAAAGGGRAWAAAVCWAAELARWELTAPCAPPPPLLAQGAW